MNMLIIVSIFFVSLMSPLVAMHNEKKSDDIHVRLQEYRRSCNMFDFLKKASDQDKSLRESGDLLTEFDQQNRESDNLFARVMYQQEQLVPENEQQRQVASSDDNSKSCLSLYFPTEKRAVEGQESNIKSCTHGSSNKMVPVFKLSGDDDSEFLEITDYVTYEEAKELQERLEEIDKEITDRYFSIYGNGSEQTEQIDCKEIFGLKEGEEKNKN